MRRARWRSKGGEGRRPVVGALSACSWCSCQSRLREQVGKHRCRWTRRACRRIVRGLSSCARDTFSSLAENLFESFADRTLQIRVGDFGWRSPRPFGIRIGHWTRRPHVLVSGWGGLPTLAQRSRASGRIPDAMKPRSAPCRVQLFGGGLRRQHLNVKHQFQSLLPTTPDAWSQA